MIEVEFDKSTETHYCIDLDTRDRYVEENLSRIKKRLLAHPDREGRIAVVCYGPSLDDTWEELKEFEFIITCSGAHKFLLDRGIVPTWHCEVDPRAHKADLIGQPHRLVEYLVSSVCHRKVLDLLEDYEVRLWHVFSHESDRKGVPQAFPRGEWAITGGSNVGLRAMVLARFLGFRKMSVFGMDYSFKENGQQHAGPHPKEVQKLYRVKVGEESFLTNGAMHYYAQQFFKEVGKIGDIDLEIKGHGLLQAQIKQHKGPLIEDKTSPIAAMTPQVISPDYVNLNRELHESNPQYGISGSKRASAVRKIINAIKPASILDYGCGKGTLAKALPFPIWEYDPAVPGKDKVPRPAELVVCTDVLEHVEPEYLPGVLLDLSRCTLKVCYAVIHTGPSLKTLPDGRNTHLIQQPLSWWKEQLSECFTVAKIEQDGPELIAVLGPKQKLPMDITPVRHEQTEVLFHTPNKQTQWRAETLLTKEPATIKWIETFNPGEVLYDIGANVGSYTVWAAKRRGVKVFAFEPEAQNYALLCKNMTLNRVDGRAYCLALSNSQILDTIYLSSQEPGGSCNTFGEKVGFDLKKRHGIEQGAVGVSLDSLQGLPKPDHIKIDIDGMEHKVIEGAKKLLSDGQVKSLLIEINTHLPEHIRMMEELDQLGFRHYPAQLRASLRTSGLFEGCGECVFTLENPVETSVLKKIREAQVISEPYPHLYIEDVFPKDFYENLTLPINGYRSLEEARGTQGYPQRFVHETPKEFYWMRSGKLRSLLNEKLGVEAVVDETLLIQDKPGYSIGPHTDTPSKAVSALFYLTRNWTHLEHGTSIYVPLNGSFKDNEGKHYREGFSLHWTAPGKPNSAFIFARTDNSFHGAEPYNGSGVRDILLYDSRK